MKANKYVRFFAKMLAFIIAIVIIDKVIGMSFVALKDYGLKHNSQCMWLKSQYVFEKVDDDIIVIGSSMATHSIIPTMITDSLGLSAYNCGQDGCFFLYQNCLINSVIERYQPKCIIWELEPHSFEKDYNSNEYQNIRYLSPYYDDNKYVKEFINSEDDKKSIHMHSQMYRYNSKVLNYIFPVIFKSSNTHNGYIPLPTTGYAFPILNNPKTGISEEWERDNQKIAILTKTLKRCKEKNISVVLVTLPTYSINTQKEVAGIETMRVLFEDMQIPYCDYSNDNRIMQAEYFKDAGHLNNIGAETFTGILINEALTPIVNNMEMN